MKLYNSMTRKKEEFVPLEPGKVKMYSCGPTVYNYFHIGNARPFIIFDTLRRYFEYRGYDVKFVQNFTDIDDKVIKKANEEGVTYDVIADRYIKEYFVDAKGLGIHPATVHPRATETMDAIIDIVKTLIDNGHAYVAANGDVYFRTKSFPGIWQAVASAAGRAAGRCPHQCRRAEGRPDGLCHLEGSQAGRTELGYAVGQQGPSGLAYRVLRNGQQVSGQDH